MSLSMDGLSSYYDTISSNANSTNRASSTTSALSGLSSDSSEEELTEAVESFESYMLEQVLKELKDTFTSEDEDEDSTMSQYTDMYMDATIQELAETMVSQYGGNLTEELVEQMKRNYGIE